MTSHSDINDTYDMSSVPPQYIRSQSSTSSDIEQLIERLPIRTILDHAPIGIALFDINIHFRYVNIALSNMNNYCPEYHVGKTFCEVIGSKAGFLEEALRSVIRTGMPSDEIIVDNTMLGWENHRVWSVTYFPISDEDYTVLGAGGYIIDITSYNDSEENIRRLNVDLTQRIQEFETLFDSLQIGVGFSRDRECKDIRLNDAFYQLLGIPKGSNASLSASDCERPQYRVFKEKTELQPKDLPIPLAVRTGVPVRDFHETVIRSDGSKIHLTGDAFPLFDEYGLVRGCIAAFRDVTDKINAEESRHQMNSWFNALVQANVIGVIHARENLIIDANEIFLNMIDYTNEEMQNGGIDWLNITPEEYISADMNGMANLLKNGFCPPYEKEFYRKDRSRVPFIIAGALIAIEPREWVCYTIDLTERKCREKELSRLYERERAIAESLQSSLLTPPQSNAYPGVEIQTLYKAAWDEAKVGGDFFDVWKCAPNKLALVVGDVSGKGLSAASRTAEVKFALRAYLSEKSTYEYALAHVNNYLCQSTQSSETTLTFVCISLAILDLDTGEIDYAGCGMDGSVILRNGKTYDPLYTTGLPLGCIDDIKYTHRHSSLQSGDILFMTTDGLTEARKGNELLGINKLVEIINEKAADQPLNVVIDQVYREVLRYAGGKLSDDTCILMVKRL